MFLCSLSWPRAPGRLCRACCLMTYLFSLPRTWEKSNTQSLRLNFMTFDSEMKESTKKGLGAVKNFQDVWHVWNQCWLGGWSCQYIWKKIHHEYGLFDPWLLNWNIYDGIVHLSLYFCIWVYVSMCDMSEHRGQDKALHPPRAGVTCAYETPNVDSGNSKHSKQWSHVSRPQIYLFSFW